MSNNRVLTSETNVQFQVSADTTLATVKNVELSKKGDFSDTVTVAYTTVDADTVQATLNLDFYATYRIKADSATVASGRVIELAAAAKAARRRR